MPRSPSSWGRQALLLLGLCSPVTADTTEIEAGQPAPAFRLPDSGGEEHQLGDYAGQWAVLYFYPKDDTPGCTAEACAFRDELELIHRLNARVLGVSMDSQESHREFADKYGLPFPLLSDPDGETVARYGAMGGMLGFRYAKRHTFLIDPEGVVRRIWRDVNPKAHAREVIEAIRELRQAPQ